MDNIGGRLMDLDDEELKATREMHTENRGLLKIAQREIRYLREEIYTLEDDIGTLLENNLELATEVHKLKLQNMDLKQKLENKLWD